MKESYIYYGVKLSRTKERIMICPYTQNVILIFNPSLYRTTLIHYNSSCVSLNLSKSREFNRSCLDIHLTKELQHRKITKAGKRNQGDGYDMLRNEESTCTETSALNKPHIHNVLGGRGGLVYSFPGNIMYRKIINANNKLREQL